MTDNDAVHGIVSELEQVAKNQRNRKFDQKRHNLSGRHIFCHDGKLPFVYFDVGVKSF